MGRFPSWLLAVLAVAVALPATAAAAPRFEVLRPARLLLPSAPVRDRVFTGGAAPATARLGADEGTVYYTASDHTPVLVYVSRAYPADPAAAQALVDFLGDLVHRPELATLAVHVQTPTELRSICGLGALACYYTSGAMYVAGEEVGGVPLEQVIAHEYGHHVAANRSNAPWPAIAYGPKRWASYLDVCRNAARKRMFPGAESLARYPLNPGEGWAEAYRVFNGERAGTWPDVGFDIVDPVFFPTDPALALIERARVSGKGVSVGWRRKTVCGGRTLRVGVRAMRRAAFRLLVSLP